MTPKKRTGRKPASAPAEAPPTTLSIRGLTPEDHAALERAVERRKRAIGGSFVSANSTVLALLRAALAREDASGTIEVGA
jgi:hypothetical protein